MPSAWQHIKLLKQLLSILTTILTTKLDINEYVVIKDIVVPHGIIVLWL